MGRYPDYREYKDEGYSGRARARAMARKYSKKSYSQHAVVRTNRFAMGQTCLTRGVNDIVANNLSFATFVTRSLKRHVTGDWGNVCQEDRSANDRALIEGNRLFSAYEETGQPKIWIITEADRASTTVLFPEEY